MPRDFKFKVRNTIQAVATKLSMYGVFDGLCLDEYPARAITWQVVNMRRAWLNAYVGARSLTADPVSNDRETYLRNCPPSWFLVEPASHACREQWCPFCWAKRAARNLAKITTGPEDQLVYLSWEATAATETAQPLFAQLAMADAQFKIAVRRAVTACCVRVITPVAADNDTVHWRAEYRVLMTLPPTAKLDRVLQLPNLGNWTVTVPDAVTLKSVRKLKRRLAEYPGEWLRQPVKYTLPLFDLLEKKRQFTFFKGRLR